MSTMSAGSRVRPGAPARRGAPVAAPAHEHEWGLRGVEFEDGASIRSFECSGCDQVWFT